MQKEIDVKLPLVSVIIPCFNAEKFIADTIESIQKQTYHHLEIIIIDDGSTDNSNAVINTYLNSDKRISYFYQKNAGVSAARNKGMSLANGDYIALLDADDYWCKDNLKKKIGLLQTNTEFDWVFSDMYHADSELNNVKISEQGTDEDILNNLLLWEGEVIPGPCSNLVFRKYCLSVGVSFNIKLSTTADLDFCIQLASSSRGKRIAEPLWIYRILSNSMSKNVRAMENDHLIIYQDANKKKLFKSFAFKQKCFSNNYLIIGGSWWINGNNKARGLYFVILALIYYPLNIKKIIKKLF